MALTDYPVKTKYAYLDYVFIFVAGYIDCVQVAGWRVIVDDPDGDDSGRQRTYYKFLDKGNLELLESKVYSSRNHLLGAIKGEYLFLNVACESRTGGYQIFRTLGLGNTDDPEVTFGDWVDLAHMDFRTVNFQCYALPSILTGTVSIISGSDQLVGNGTLFSADIISSLPILINHFDGNPNGIVRKILSIEDDEHLTLSSIVNTNYTDVPLFQFEYGDPQKGSGTVSFSSGTNAVVGEGTNFTILQPNDLIQVKGDNGAIYSRIVDTVTDNTHLTTKANIPATGTSTNWYNYERVIIDVGFLGAYHGNGSSPEEIQFAKAVVVDGSNFAVATMPSYLDTKEKFRDYVRSYDADTTIWTDNTPMGRP